MTATQLAQAKEKSCVWVALALLARDLGRFPRDTARPTISVTRPNASGIAPTYACGILRSPLAGLRCTRSRRGLRAGHRVRLGLTSHLR